ncbi:MAG: hypothetical protein LBQ94_12420 [Treponema sp.]|nr:hypothetical protein [Treponema sp.]
MKNNMKLFGIIALAAVIGFSVIACDNGTTGGGLNGTYFSRSGERLVLNNGTLTLSQNNTETIRGTYSARGSDITGTVTQLKGSYLNNEGLYMLGLSSSQWYTQQALRTAIINYFVGQGIPRAQAEAAYNTELASSINEIYGPFTGTYSAGTLTLRIFGNYFTYTKQ